MSALLQVENYSGGFRAADGAVSSTLQSVSYGLEPGRMTAVVGETGSGKSLVALSVLGLQPPGFVRTAGRILFEGTEMGAQHGLRGRRISMVFQDARAALNPVFTVGQQLADVYRLHHGGSSRAAAHHAIEALRRVHMPEAERRARQYPHEFSGGMAQRAMIAMAALVCTPSLLILDEPTTGLDVTIQSDIMELIVELGRARGLTTCLITHDLGIVAESCEDVVVMHAGRVVETGTAEAIFTRPQQPYTRRLIAASRLEPVA